jgi:uncharacterized protein
MKFQHTAKVDAPIDEVWSWLMDVPRIAQCVPGVDSVEPIENDRFRGTIKVSVGPIRLALHGDVWITERDEQAHRAAMRAEAADRQAGGSVKANLTMSLTEVNGGTEMLMETDAHVLGRIGDFGQPVIRKKADQTVSQFATNLQQAIDAKA